MSESQGERDKQLFSEANSAPPQTVSEEPCEYIEYYPNAPTYRCVLPRGHLGYHRATAPAVSEEPGAPKVVCLCGSTRFYREYQIANFDETLAGHIVLSVGFYPHSQEHHEEVGLTNAGYDESIKEALDELHKRKIDLADEVLVISPSGYIGDSTRSEIEYAQAHGKPVGYREDFPPPVPESEPVAIHQWRLRKDPNGGWTDGMCGLEDDDDVENRILFTHPPVESEPRREAHETRWSLLAARVTLKQLSDDPLQRQFADAILRQMASVEEELPVPVESEGAREAGMRKILEEGLADIDQHKLKVRSALYGDVEFWKLRKVVEAALTSTPEADIAAGRVERFDSMSEAIAGLHSPAGKEGFWCPHCGFVRADEDGCCAACGADCEVVEASPAVTERGEPEK